MATPIQIPVGRCSSGRRNMTCSTQESLRSLSPTGSFVLPLFDGNAGMHTNRGIGLWAAFITAPRLCPARTCTGGHIYGAPGPAGSRRPGSSLPRPRRPYHHMPMARVWTSIGRTDAASPHQSPVEIGDGETPMRWVGGLCSTCLCMHGINRASEAAAL